MPNDLWPLYICDISSKKAYLLDKALGNNPSIDGYSLVLLAKISF